MSSCTSEDISSVLCGCGVVVQERGWVWWNFGDRNVEGTPHGTHAHGTARHVAPQSGHAREQERERARESETWRVRFCGGGRGWGCARGIAHRPLCLRARGVFHINRQEYTRAHTRQNTCTHTTLPSCAPPPPKRRRRVTFDGKVRNSELWAIVRLQIRFPIEDRSANTLSTADRLRHHCKLGGDSASIPGTSAYRWSIRGTRRVVRGPTRAV